MAEYWHFKDDYREKGKAFFEQKLEPTITQEFKIDEKDFINAGNASAQIKVFLKRLGVNSEVLRRVAVTSYEAEINITAHAYGGVIKSNIYDDLVHIVFHDYGPGVKDIELAMQPGWSTADEYVREHGFGAGLGLPNIKKNSDVMHLISAEGEPTFLEVLIFFN